MNTGEIRFIIISVMLAAVGLLGLTCGTSAALPRVDRAVENNQLVLLLSEDHSLPFVTIQLLVDAGSRRDPSGKEGLASLTSACLLLGTSSRNAAAINEELDFMGASLTASTNRDYVALNLRVLKKDLDKGLDLLADVLVSPAFPADEIRKEAAKSIAAIQASEDQPEEVADKAFMRTLFPFGPYGHPVKGTKESVAKLTADDLEKFYRAYYRPNNAVLTVVGDMSMQEVNARLLPRLAKWEKAPIPEESFDASYEKERKTIKIDRHITQANVIIGEKGVSRDNPDFYALTVMNYILGGGGFASRLTEEIRNKRGLAYDVASFFDPGRYPGSFQIVLQTKNATAREAVALSREQMELMRKEPVSDKELDGAKKYLIGSFPMRFDTQSKLANFLSQVEYYHLGMDYPARYPSIISAVTKEEVLRVAKKYLHPDDTILVIVADLKEAGME